MIEGTLDYDFDEFADQASQKMGIVLRLGSRHAVCLAIHESVWMDVGYFRSTPKLWGYEDTLFFHEIDRAQIPTAWTGASWLHHFGSITQSEIKKERGLREKDSLGQRYENHKLLQQSWLERKLSRAATKRQVKNWRNAEVNEFGMSLHGWRENGEFIWR